MNVTIQSSLTYDIVSNPVFKSSQLIKENIVYITDNKIKQGVLSYIRFKYNVNVESNQVYVFFQDMAFNQKNNYYYVVNYIDYETDYFPNRLNAVEIDKWGMLLQRKDKIYKIKDKI